MGKRIIVEHHHRYKDEKHRLREIKGYCYQGEHKWLTEMEWRTQFSKHCVRCIKSMLPWMERDAVELEGGEK